MWPRQLCVSGSSLGMRVKEDELEGKIQRYHRSVGTERILKIALRLASVLSGLAGKWGINADAGSDV